MSTNLTVKIAPDGGAAICLYRDEFNLRDLGEMTVERASDVFFDSEAQKWAVRILGEDERVLPERFDKRSDAISHEIEVLQRDMPSF